MRGKKTALANLPVPPLAMQALSQELTQFIRRRLLGQGELSFAQFMEMALYTPGLGYYANGLAKFGQGGDFITAPELSPLFGQCVARQVVEVLARVSQGSVLELGAGSGALAVSVLQAMDQLDALPEQYAILEPSASLQARQKAYLAASLDERLMARVVWLTSLPQGFVGVIVGNEVVDALPVEVLRFLPDATEQGFVQWDDALGVFAWLWHDLVDRDLLRLANQLRNQIGVVSKEGYMTEVRPVLPAWMHSLSEALQQGAILLIDYGYSRQEYYSDLRWMGSLRAHYQQRAHQDVFRYPGLQDLTAHVDFTALAEAGHAAGLTVAGYATQAHFLLSLGILELVDPKADVVTHLKLAQQIKTLTMPDEMGENFKAMAFLKGVDGRLSGFGLRDLRMML